MNHSFNTYVFLNDSTPSEEKFDFRARNLGSGSGLGAMLIPSPHGLGGKEICENCNYTILIEAYKNAIIQIRTHGYSDIIPIEPYERVSDYTTIKLTK